MRLSAELSEITMTYSLEGHEPVGDGRVRTVEQARDVTRGFLLMAAPRSGNAAESVLLVVSELFDNAVRHAGGASRFQLKAGPGTVTVEVGDASTDPPRTVPADAGTPGGLGWQLVQDLAQSVHVRVHATGKTVTAIVPCPTDTMPHVR